MITVGIEGRMARRERAHSPAGEHVVVEQTIGDLLYKRLINNRGGDAMTRIRSDRADLTLLRVESERDEPFVLHPENLVETLLQFLGLLIQLLRLIGPA